MSDRPRGDAGAIHAARRAAPDASMASMEQIDDARWETVRTRGSDDSFLIGVKTTSIYCRSGCPARTPSRSTPPECSD